MIFDNTNIDGNMSKMTIGVIGSGTMGAGIAQVAATAGHRVIVFDSQPTALEKAQKNLVSAFERLVEKGKYSAAEAQQIKERMVWTSALQDLKPSMLVIEAIVENLEVKQSVFKSLETAVSADCILASNTSSLSITGIAGGCQCPERVMGLHFFNPAPLMPLVEIIGGVNTANEHIQTVQALVKEWGKTGVLAKDTPGFIVNRVARPFYGEALRIAEEGIADFATIDWAMREFGQFKMGPFELMDLIGNDINYTVTETVWRQLYFDTKYKPSLIQKRMVEAGRLGRKSGQGYFNYALGAAKASPRAEAELGKSIFQRIVCMLINEAIENLYLQTASAADLDLAVTKGVNYPKGLLQWADELGLEHVLQQLEQLFSLYGEDRYRPSVLLKRKVAAGESFFNTLITKTT